ncbi:hypothetical protein SARC_05587 [Sphaeroforma arctica JP610]|uniref:Uncharacterized protein n=1 Tax=Sphaeroforma arctica JP610 TaxID=667725 RepID=A0A0L0G1R1_9EUKA|nr:hypothetical protein SARC_05587 [Sphaeroforma arctica JP610]KNC82118.1 hypothetical protein SARC_05587 [Sphaeroforma arctica JP610]|eukprot:XP_014156020.1 hypothetical protein SARC_05587 [Sphaeroforma arctica JP610]
MANSLESKATSHSTTSQSNDQQQANYYTHNWNHCSTRQPHGVCEYPGTSYAKPNKPKRSQPIKPKRLQPNKPKHSQPNKAKHPQPNKAKRSPPAIPPLFQSCALRSQSSAPLLQLPSLHPLSVPSIHHNEHPTRALPVIKPHERNNKFSGLNQMCSLEPESEVNSQYQQ